MPSSLEMPESQKCSQMPNSNLFRVFSVYILIHKCPVIPSDNLSFLVVEFEDNVYLWRYISAKIQVHILTFEFAM